MKRVPRPLKTIIASAGVVSVLVLGGALPTFAVAETGVTITGGSLTGGAATFSDFTGITLGAGTTATSSWGIGDVTDARGSGAGWNVSLTMSQLTEYLGAAYIAGGKTIPTSSIKVTTASSVTLVGSTGSATGTITPAPVTTALDTTAPVSLLSAALNGGMGTYHFGNLIATLTIPNNTYAKLYKSDATLSTNLVP